MRPCRKNIRPVIGLKSFQMIFEQGFFTFANNMLGYGPNHVSVFSSEKPWSLGVGFLADRY